MAMLFFQRFRCSDKREPGLLLQRDGAGGAEKGSGEERKRG